MNLWRSLEGVLRLRVISADPRGLLEKLIQGGCRLQHVSLENDLTLCFQCSRKKRKIVTDICRKQGGELAVLSEIGLFYQGMHLLRRPVLLGGILFFLILTLFLPTRVLFIRVEGNTRIPERQILEAARECGLGFGTSRRALRSEKIKNALIHSLPELKWAGITTAGCTAVISVQESEPEAAMPESAFGHIVAVRDGYITACTATRGTLLCVPGQTVQEGQVLISGYTDCGICIQAARAEGIIRAQTIRRIRAVTPGERLLRVTDGDPQRRYSLLIGKKRINLWKGSGISTPTCDRMYAEYYVTLPGGFSLPIGLGMETLTQCSTAVQTVLPEDLQPELAAFTRDHTQSMMHDGRILSESSSVSQQTQHIFLEARYLCEEMIGRFTEEQGYYRQDWRYKWENQLNGSSTQSG